MLKFQDPEDWTPAFKQNENGKIGNMLQCNDQKLWGTWQSLSWKADWRDQIVKKTKKQKKPSIQRIEGKGCIESMLWISEVGSSWVLSQVLIDQCLHVQKNYLKPENHHLKRVEGTIHENCIRPEKVPNSQQKFL